MEQQIWPVGAHGKTLIAPQGLAFIHSLLAPMSLVTQQNEHVHTSWLEKADQEKRRLHGEELQALCSESQMKL